MKTIKIFIIAIQVTGWVLFNWYCWRSDNHTGFPLKNTANIALILGEIVFLVVIFRHSFYYISDPLGYIIAGLFFLFSLNIFIYYRLNIFLDYEEWIRRGMPPRPWLFR